MRWLAWVMHLLCAPALAQDRYDPRNYEPPQFAGAECHVRVPFLPEARDWERVDVYVPKEPADAKLPCVVFFYGGGWGGKVTGGLAPEMKQLLARGYVVALPDYLLGASQPVPQAIWDGAAAVRFLRANAVRYRIDPERIGAWGFSAGGWLAQYLAPSDSTTLWAIEERAGGRRGQMMFFPMLDPHPAHEQFSARLTAFVTDWGAGKLDEGRMHKWNPSWLSPDDPAVFTCHNSAEGQIPLGPRMLRAVGGVAEVVQLDVNNTHSPNPNSPSRDKPGWTWRQHVQDFLDRQVKNPAVATAPEIIPHGGPISGPTQVTLRSVHPTAQIRYTTDGSVPTAKSLQYSEALTVQPGTTVRAIAIRDGLQPSRVATAVFTATKLTGPKITTREHAFGAKVGQPFEAQFAAEGAEGVQWNIAGKLGVTRTKTNRWVEEPWLTMDGKTGRLSGTPPAAGVCVFVVSAAVVEQDKTALCDAVSIVVTITE